MPLLLPTRLIIPPVVKLNFLEVEHFRHLLLPLVYKKKPLCVEHDKHVDGNTNSNNLFLECPSQTPPKKFPPKSELVAMNNKYRVRDVERKGKLLRLVLERALKEEKPGVDKSKFTSIFFSFRPTQ